MNALLNITLECRCGNDKKPGALFCDECYDRLPIKTKMRINRAVREVGTVAAMSADWLERNA